MRYFIITLALGWFFMAGCDILSPGTNQVTIEASNTSGSCCPVTVNLDGNNAVALGSGASTTFPTAGTGSHTLNFSTSGNCAGSNGCVYQNNNSANYSTTFSTSGGKVYVGTVKSGSSSYQLAVTVSGG